MHFILLSSFSAALPSDVSNRLHTHIVSGQGSLVCFGMPPDSNSHLADGRVRAVVTRQGSIEADYVILAVCNGTRELAAKAGMHVPLKESKGILAHATPQVERLKRVMTPPNANFDGRIITGANFSYSGDAQPTMEAAAARYFP
jgi:glycine/D-amino acid oxidase-like deaminating enzyme